LLKTWNTLVFLRESCSTCVFLLTGSWTILLFWLGYMKCQKENECKQILPKVEFFKIKCVKNVWNYVFDMKNMAVLPPFFKVLLEFSAYDSFITKTENTMKYQEIQGNNFPKTWNIRKYLKIVENTKKFLVKSGNTKKYYDIFLCISIFGNTYFSHILPLVLLYQFAYKLKSKLKMEIETKIGIE
jgi:hypothetical protein